MGIVLGLCKKKDDQMEDKESLETGMKVKYENFGEKNKVTTEPPNDALKLPPELDLRQINFDGENIEGWLWMKSWSQSSCYTLKWCICNKVSLRFFTKNEWMNSHDGTIVLSRFSQESFFDEEQKKSGFKLFNPAAWFIFLSDTDSIQEQWLITVGVTSTQPPISITMPSSQSIASMVTVSPNVTYVYPHVFPPPATSHKLVDDDSPEVSRRPNSFHRLEDKRESIIALHSQVDSIDIVDLKFDAKSTSSSFAQLHDVENVDEDKEFYLNSRDYSLSMAEKEEERTSKIMDNLKIVREIERQIRIKSDKLEILDCFLSEKINSEKLQDFLDDYGYILEEQ